MFRRAPRPRAAVSPASLLLFRSSVCEFLRRRNTFRIARTFLTLSMTSRSSFHGSNYDLSVSQRRTMSRRHYSSSFLGVKNSGKVAVKQNVVSLLEKEQNVEL